MSRGFDSVRRLSVVLEQGRKYVLGILVNRLVKLAQEKAW